MYWYLQASNALPSMLSYSTKTAHLELVLRVVHRPAGVHTVVHLGNVQAQPQLHASDVHTERAAVAAPTEVAEVADAPLVRMHAPHAIHGTHAIQVSQRAEAGQVAAKAAAVVQLLRRTGHGGGQGRGAALGRRAAGR